MYRLLLFLNRADKELKMGYLVELNLSNEDSL